MKILGLQIEGIGKIKALEMSFKDKGLIPIVGKNNQGKTTILNCIEMLISGGNMPSDIINHDSKKGVIVANLEGYTVKKVFTEKTTRLEVTSEQGAVASPQSFLTSLVNSVSFNPFSFINKTSLEKVRDMMLFAGIDFSELDKKLKDAESERLYLGRAVKEFGVIDLVEKVDYIDISFLEVEKKDIEEANKRAEKERNDKLLVLQQATIDHNEVVRNKKRLLEESDKSVFKITEDIVKKEDEILELKKLLDVKITEGLKLHGELEGVEEKDLKEITLPVPELLPLDEIEAKITAAKETNVKAQLFKDYCAKTEQLDKRAGDHENAEEFILSLRQKKIDTLKNAKLPVEGLAIQEDGIYLNGIHSENLSTSEAIKLACDLCISKNPKLRAITIDRGESFDSENLKYIQEWGVKNDMQCFITIVDQIPEDKIDGVFYIEEGELCK